MKPIISRRTLLQGAAATLALPYLEALGQTAAGPKRLLIVYDGTGGAPRSPSMPNVFYPAAMGAGFELTPILEPLARHRDRMMVLGGIDNNASWRGPLRSANGGGHTSAFRCNFTGTSYGGRSIDQVIADRIGQGTRLKSLHYNTAYNASAFWEARDIQVPFADTPCALFERIFGRMPTEPAPPPPPNHLPANRRSVVDAVARSTERLKTSLGRSDRQTLDRYLETVRAVERRLGAARPVDCTGPSRVSCNTYREDNLLYWELMATALTCGVTRVGTISMGDDVNLFPMFSHFGTGSWHDDFEHRAHDTPAKTAAVIEWQRFLMARVALLVDALKAAPEGDGTVFDNTLILFTNELSHADNHNHDDMPYLLIGGRAFDSHFKFGEHRRFSGASNNQLFASLYNAFAPGAPLTQFGEPEFGTGVLAGLS